MPATTQKLHLQTGPDAQLELHWECPAGRVPGNCLEWEVAHNQELPDGKQSTVCFTSFFSVTMCQLDPFSQGLRSFLVGMGLNRCKALQSQLQKAGLGCCESYIIADVTSKNIENVTAGASFNTSHYFFHFPFLFLRTILFHYLIWLAAICFIPFEMSY